MSAEIPEINDLSRVDAYARARQKVALRNALWKPMLAGAAGAALVIGAVTVAIVIAMPRFSTREVVVDHVTQRNVPFDSYIPESKNFDNAVPVNKDVSVPNVVLVPRDVPVEVPRFVPRDTPFNNFVPHETVIDIPRVVVTSPSPLPPSSTAPAAPQTPGAPPFETPAPTPTPVTPQSPEEFAFIDSPEWRDAYVAGRIVGPFQNGFIIATDAGRQSFFPSRIGAGGVAERNPTVREDVSALIGALTRCERLPNGTFACVSWSRGRKVTIPEIPIGQGRPT